MRFPYAFALCLFAYSLLAVPRPAEAQTQDNISEQLTQRAHDVLRLLQGEEIETEVFDENFRNAVPPAQFRALTAQVRAQQGEPLAVESIAPQSANSATLRIRFEKAIGTLSVALEASPPHRVSGLLLTSFEDAATSLDEVLATIDALPGRQGLLIQRLEEADPRPIASLDPDGRYAIASSFKLYILAELDRAVRAGERQWSDVVQLGPKSHPSGISQNWPDKAPMTLHTLATLMISISDNSATDTLIRVIGQERLAEIVRITGHHDPAEMYPMLMTRQASALKMPVHAERRDRFLAVNPAEREKLLAEFDKALTLESLDLRLLTSKPNFIDQLEWFATPRDMIRLLAYIDRNASDETRSLLTVNPGIGQDAARKWSYFGYKGGSEPGVLSYNFLLRSNAGESYAVSLLWNNEAASLQDSALLALTTRLVNLLAAQ